MHYQHIEQSLLLPSNSLLFVIVYKDSLVMNHYMINLCLSWSFIAYSYSALVVRYF